MAEYEKHIIQYKEQQSDLNWSTMTIQVDTSATINFALMEEPFLQIKSTLYSKELPQYKKLKPFLVKTNTHSGVFYLVDIPKITKISNNHYSCEMYFMTDEYKLDFIRFKDLDNRLTFSLTMNPQNFLEMVVLCMNAKDSGWTVGAYHDNLERTVSFDKSTCRQALQMIADEFGLEFEIINKEISIRKVEYYLDDPLNLAYGANRGLLSGITVDSARVQQVELLYAHGGERNIDPTKNGGVKYLLLPKYAEIDYNGDVFSYPSGIVIGNPEPGYRRYITDNKGTYIRRKDVAILSGYEDVYVSEDIYPHRIGTVTQVIYNAGDDSYDFIDSGNTIDYSPLRIAGETAKIKFESGKLAGFEFDLVQTKKAVTGYDHTQRRFMLVSQDRDGQRLPNQTMSIQVGDKYAVFGIQMPSQYILDNTNKSGASWDLLRESVKYLYDRESGEVTVTMRIDPVYCNEHWRYIEDYIKIGAYYLILDEEITGELLKVRVLGIKQNLFYKEKIELVLSNTHLRKNYRTEIDVFKAKFTNDNWHLRNETLSNNANVTLMRPEIDKGKVIALPSEKDIYDFVNVDVNLVDLLAGTRLTSLREKNIDFIWDGSKLKPITSTPKLADSEKLLSINNEYQVVSSISTKKHKSANGDLLWSSINGKDDVEIGKIPNDWISLNFQKMEEAGNIQFLTNAIIPNSTDVKFVYQKGGGDKTILPISNKEFSVNGLSEDSIYSYYIEANVEGYGVMRSKEYVLKTNISGWVTPPKTGLCNMKLCVDFRLKC